MSHQGWLTYEYRVAIADYLLRHELTGGAKIDPQARRHGRAPQALVELVLVSREPCP